MQLYKQFFSIFTKGLKFLLQLFNDEVYGGINASICKNKQVFFISSLMFEKAFVQYF